MASNNNDYDGLHVQNVEQIYKPQQPAHETKEVASPMSSPAPYYTPQPQGHYFAAHTSQAHPQPQPRYHEAAASNPSQNPRRNPWGLSPLAFAALIALITAVIVGGAVGGGVAASKSKDATCSAASHTSTVTSVVSGTNTASSTASGSTTAPTGTFRNYIPPAPANVESLFNDCNSLNGSVVISAQGTTFKLTCPQAILGSGGSSGVTLSETVAYTLQDCVNACSLMNYWRGSTVCNSVTWDNGMAGATAQNFGGNCWLFDDSSVFTVKANSTSARLQDSS